MNWWSAVDELLLAAFWMLAPGAALAWAAGVRRLWVLLAAPPASVGVLAALAVLLDIVDVPWGMPSALAGSAVLAALVWAVRRLVRIVVPVGPRAAATPGVGVRFVTLAPLTGTVVGGLLTVVVLMAGMRSPDHFPQTWDTVFHLNATRWVLDQGTASSLQVGLVNQPWGQAPIFYPAAWHALTSLSTTGSVVVSNNAVALVVAGLAWPAGLAALARAVAPRVPLLALVAPILGAGFQAFPTRMLTWGVLWPNALAYALVPAALAVGVVALRGRGERVGVGPLGALLAMLVAGGTGIALAQPNAVLVLGFLAVPYAVARAATVSRDGVRRLRHRGPGAGQGVDGVGRAVLTAVGPPVLLAAGLAGLYATLRLFASQMGETTWRGTAGLTHGAWYALSDGAPPLWDGTAAQSSNLVLVALIAVGAFALAFRAGARWLLGALVVAVVMGAIGERTFRFSWVIYPWFSDATRLRGIAPLVTSLVAAYGVVAITRLVVRVMRGRRGLVPVTVGVIVVVVGATCGLRAPDRYHMVAETYVAPLSGTHASSLVSTDELAMLERLDDELTPGAVLLGNPFTGAALAFALSDVPVVFTHMNGRWSEDAWFASENITKVGTDPRVCEALDRLDVGYLYVDGVAHWAFFDQPPFSGIPVSAPDVSGFERVDSGGTAAVYRITACG